MTTKHDIFTLHRYYIWANRMRVHFDEVLKKNLENKIPKNQFEIESRLYMAYWYGGLYVVIEGWKRLELVDETVNQLLRSKNVGLLKRYRHGVFHFQPNYNDKKFLDFIVDGENCVEWIRQLNLEFGRFFLEWFKRSP
ncbi:MAG: hypothetical protein A2Z88_03290 [Omnitrophica WOR_2 bacterium GWA2_47_8]|nr:MAG: hypothetical protein A2Z88_03290 [Omnitrophica WOR_2 bacterium GWA2_47_8]